MMVTPCKENLPGIAQGIIEIGKNLIEVKHAIGHGNWLTWLEIEGCISQSTAKRFIQISDSFGNRPRVGDLNIAIRALDILAQNSTPDEVRQTAITMAESGEQVTAKTAKELKEKDAEIQRLQSEPSPSSACAL